MLSFQGKNIFIYSGFLSWKLGYLIFFSLQNKYLIFFSHWKIIFHVLFAWKIFDFSFSMEISTYYYYFIIFVCLCVLAILIMQFCLQTWKCNRQISKPSNHILWKISKWDIKFYHTVIKFNTTQKNESMNLNNQKFTFIVSVVVNIDILRKIFRISSLDKFYTSFSLVTAITWCPQF